VRLINDKRAESDTYCIKKLKEENNKLKHILQQYLHQCFVCNEFIEDEENMLVSECICVITICNTCKNCDNGVMDICAGCGRYSCVKKCLIKCDGCDKLFCKGKFVKYCSVYEYKIYGDRCAKCPYPLPYVNSYPEKMYKYNKIHKSLCKSCFQLKTKN